jgi:hypothetical protein
LDLNLAEFCQLADVGFLAHTPFNGYIKTFRNKLHTASSAGGR